MLFKIIITGLVSWWVSKFIFALFCLNRIHCTRYTFQGVGCATIHHRRHESKYSALNQLDNTIKYPSIYESKNCLHNLCTNVTNYPSIYIQNVISKSKQFDQYFGSVIQPYNQPRLSAKSSQDYEERNMCDTIQFKYFPELAKNKLNKRVIIVNVENFRQAVSFETCV